MKYSPKTISTLIRLRDGEQVNDGELSSKQVKNLVDELHRKAAVSFNRRGKLRGYYVVTDRDRFLDACRQVDSSLVNLEDALRLANGELDKRKEKVALFGNSKQGGADKTMKGFTLLADRKTSVEYLGDEVRIGPLTGLHVVNYPALVLPKDATVVIVENPECFYDHGWIPLVGLSQDSGPYIVLCRTPFCEQAKLWLESIPNRILYFGDFDLGGVRIYETEFKRRLGNRISFIVPDDIEERVRRRGNSDLYSKQVNEFKDSVKSEELDGLIRLLHHLQSGYEQEGYCLPL